MSNSWPPTEEQLACLPSCNGTGSSGGTEPTEPMFAGAVLPCCICYSLDGEIIAADVIKKYDEDGQRFGSIQPS